LPALAVYRKRRVLRGAWALSHGRFWRLAAVIVVAVAAPVVAVQAVGEVLSYQLVSPIAVHGAQSLFHAADTLATDTGALVVIVLTLSLSTAVGLTLTTISSCLIYRHLAERP
jgi:hypothetical protein